MKNTIIRPLFIALLVALTLANTQANEAQSSVSPSAGHEVEVSHSVVADTNAQPDVALPVKDKLHAELEMNMDNNIELLIPIFGIVFTFGSPIAIIWIIAAYSARRRRLNHETIEKFINAGLPIPNELLADTKPNSGSDSTRHKGVIMTFLGIALLIVLSELIDHQVATIALIPMLLGIAYLVSWKLTKNDAKDGQVE